MEIGQIYDIFELLATPERDYLVRNNGDKVNVKDIKGKNIGIYSVPLGKQQYSGQYSSAEDLKSCYRHRMAKEDFEVVFVPLVVDEDVDSELFDNFFSKMPWLAIPHHDIESIKCLQKYFRHCLQPTCIILDPNGLVIAKSFGSRLRLYGSSGYPFTDVRIKEMRQEDRSVVEKNTLTSHLTSPSRDFLINNQGERVPVRTLEGKVVGLYFYERSCCLNAPEVAKIYQTLKDRGKNFEIVLINTCEREKQEEEFEEDFRSMPWLAWPLSDKNYLRLNRTFGCTEGKLIVVDGPNMDYTDEYGMDVLCEYGIDAYPFTRRGAAVLEMKKLKEHSLQTILASLGQDFSIGKDGRKVQHSELRGKSIVLFVATLSTDICNVVIDKMIEWYVPIKMKDDTFEVIYVPWVDEGEDDTFSNESYLKMPWLVSSPLRKDVQREVYFCEVFKVYDKYRLPLVVAFGRDGSILTRRVWQKLEKDGVDAYPFNDDELVDEVLYQINYRHMWPTVDV